MTSKLESESYGMQGMDLPPTLAPEQQQAWQRDKAFLEQLTDNSKARAGRGPASSGVLHACRAG